MTEMPQQPQPAAPQPQQFNVPAFQAVPTVTRVDQQPMADGSLAVALHIHDVTGHKCVLLPPAAAEQIGQHLMDTAHKCGTGIIVVRGNNGDPTP